ncbi:hypothetical protein EDB81DRAFT_890624 [Dactylonectria macrodidyma]|uniref:Uncharacterized protein n=1 Tax=Dactylonectria macrodidyma TaxID=307937 RepID=A0A9P9DPY7_9HYPO|nr:hypothetical protein EDB81DRAFT_890624 [Dactylonectria macrodidyma]
MYSHNHSSFHDHPGASGFNLGGLNETSSILLASLPHESQEGQCGNYSIFVLAFTITVFFVSAIRTFLEWRSVNALEIRIENLETSVFQVPQRLQVLQDLRVPKDPPVPKARQDLEALLGVTAWFVDVKGNESNDGIV